MLVTGLVGQSDSWDTSRSYPVVARLSVVAESSRGAHVTQASPRGTYLVIADALRQQIQGESPPEVLPSEASLMRQHGVSRTTVRRALQALADSGLIESAPGVGWTVGRAGDRRSLAARITDVIRADGLEPGDTFPSESRLCERFLTSRTAVRRALAQLEGKGILHAVHGKGRIVSKAPIASKDSAEPSHQRDDDAHDELLRRAAGVASATLVCHRDTWDFLIDLSSSYKHPQLPGPAEAAAGRVEVQLSGRILSALLDMLWRAQGPEATAASTALAATLYRAIADTLHHVESGAQAGKSTRVLMEVV
jgi:DNA-binding GntR family transcriptional regulator